MLLVMLSVLSLVAAVVPAMLPRRGPPFPTVMCLVTTCCLMMFSVVPVVLMALCLVMRAILFVLARVAAAAPVMLAWPVWLPLGMVFHRALARLWQPVLAARTIQPCMIMLMLVMTCCPVGLSVILCLVVPMWCMAMVLMVPCLMLLAMLSVPTLMAAAAPVMLASPVWLPLGMVFHHVLTRWGQPVLAARTI